MIFLILLEVVTTAAVTVGGKRKDRTEETTMNSSSHNNNDDDDVDADTLHDRLTIAQVELTLALQTVQDKRKKCKISVHKFVPVDGTN
jgi:hypothetical protein